MCCLSRYLQKTLLPTESSPAHFGCLPKYWATIEIKRNRLVKLRAHTEISSVTVKGSSVWQKRDRDGNAQ